MTSESDQGSESEQELVAELLKQQETMLSELRWTYAQLERIQETEITALKERVSELEDAVAETDSGFAAKTRRQVGHTVERVVRRTRRPRA